MIGRRAAQLRESGSWPTAVSLTENPIRPLYLDFRRGRLREKDWPWPS
jgi:hypothetical protein